jgi:hypothetical protein
MGREMFAVRESLVEESVNYDAASIFVNVISTLDAAKSHLHDPE